MVELNDLSCPFTWKLNKVHRTPDGGFISTDDDKDLGPCMLFLKVLNVSTTAYHLCENNSLEDAIKDIEKAENSFDMLKENIPNGLSIKAVEQVVKGTKCFILQKMKKSDDVKNILETVPLCEDTFELGEQKAIEYALKAIKLNPQNGIWHFLLADSLRQIRRSINLIKQPTTQEQKAFETAFKLQADPYLALGFMSFKDYENARICLDYVETRAPDNTMFLHYKGIYLNKCLKDYEGALRYFEKAGVSLNFVADISYISLQMRLTHGRYDPLSYLKTMLERYGQFGGYRVQTIYMHMGAFYDLSRGDAKNACKYYLQAIDIDPQCQKLQEFYSDISEKKFSIFDALRRHILPKLKRLRDPDDTISEMIKKAEKYCQEDRESFEEMMKRVQI